jgi:hypothetical protein
MKSVSFSVVRVKATSQRKLVFERFYLYISDPKTLVSLTNLEGDDSARGWQMARLPVLLHVVGSFGIRFTVSRSRTRTRQHDIEKTVEPIAKER